MLCILLGIAGTCVYAASAMLEENTTATTEEPTQELVPMMARGCPCIVTKYDSSGNIYSVTFYNEFGQEETRIDYQDTPHFIDGEYRLPHQHNYTYHYGPNGEGPSRTDDQPYMDFRQWQ